MHKRVIPLETQIIIVGQNVILTFLVGGWVLRELVSNFDVAKCSNIAESYLCPKHIFHSPKLTKTFNAILHNNIFHEIKVTNVNEIWKNKVKLEVNLWLSFFNIYTCNIKFAITSHICT